MLDNKDKFQAFFIEEEGYDVERYIKSGVWVPANLLAGLTHLTKRDILVISDTGPNFVHKSDLYVNELPPINICHENGNHFTVLLPLQGDLQVGFAEEAPIKEFLSDQNLDLSALKKLTSYNKMSQHRYPNYPRSIQNATAESNHVESMSSKKSETSKIRYHQMPLVFPKRSPSNKTENDEEKFFFVL
jgi:hypothetical protein